MKINNFIDKLNYIIINALFLLLPIIYILDIYRRFFPFLFRLQFHKILWALIPIQIFIYCFNLKTKKIKITVYDIVLYVLLILGMISTNLAIDMSTSIWGAYLRNEGFLSILSYYLLFLNCKNVITKEQIKKIIKLYIIIGLIQYVFCILQVFVRGPYELPILYGIKYMASGFHGNPNFLGSHLVLFLGLTTTMYLLEEKSKFYLIVSILFFSNLVLAASTGPFLSIIFTIVFTIVFLAIKKKILWKKVIILIISLALTYFMTNFISKEIFTKKYNDKLQTSYTIESDLKSTFDILTNKEKDKNVIKGYGSGRLILWQNTLKLVPKYFFFGCGIDNLGYAYAMENDGSGVYYDKVHNEYLQTLVTQGIFTTITYLTLLAIIFFRGLKCNNNLTITLFISFIGYSVQAFLNISVVTVAPFYFIIMGLLVNQIEQEKTKKLQ